MKISLLFERKKKHLKSDKKHYVLRKFKTNMPNKGIIFFVLKKAIIACMQKPILLCLLPFFLISQEVTDDLIDAALNNPDIIKQIEKNSDSGEQEKLNAQDQSIDDISQKNDEETNIEENVRYGLNYINKIPKSISATSDLPVPNDYIISLGDEIKIILTGGRKEILTLKVGLDGTLLFPELGTINIFGDTLEVARKKIENLVGLSYVGTEAFVSLEKLTAKKINILGAVKTPGTYIVNPFNTISSALAYAGGFEEYASVREILLIRGEEITTYDLYDLIIFGKRDKDLNIQQGDTIFIKATSNLIQVSGHVNRPSVYEFKSNESIEDIISYSMGLRQNANTKNIALTYLDKTLGATSVMEIDFNEDQFLNRFENPMKIEVFSIELNSNKNIRVIGPLQNQGYFEIPSSRLLKDLVSKLIFTDEINPFIAVVQEGNNSKLFSLIDINTQNISLENNSEILFFDKFDTFEDIFNESPNRNFRLSNNSLKLLKTYALKIYYERSTIEFPTYGEINASDIIGFLGLDLSGINTLQTTYVSPIDNFSVTKNLDEIIFKSSKSNTLSLRSFSDQTITINVEGEVNMPGLYIVNSGTSLDELYKLTGGLTDQADSNSVIFTRERIREKNLEELNNARNLLREKILLSSSSDSDPNLSILLGSQINEDALGRISGDLTYDSPRKKEFLLEDGDTLFIPKRLTTVSVLGQVLKPSSFIYEKDRDIKDLVNLAGGFSPSADKRNVFVIRSNGLIVRSGGGIFNRQIKIMPGDTVVIPTDFRAGDRIIDQIAPITSILSNLAFSAAAIENLRK